MIKLTKKNINRFKKGLLGAIISLTAISGIYVCANFDNYIKNTEIQNIETIPYYAYNDRALEENEVQYLSEVEPIVKRSGYGSIVYDKGQNGALITLKIENNWFSFQKGVFAHATSTLVYDLNNNDDTYNYFTTFIGMNSSTSSGNGVIYHFYTSTDNKNWTEVTDSIKKLPGENATFVSIPLEGVRYLKLYIDSNGANGNDHSVYADAKFVKEVKDNYVLPSVQDFDAQINSKYTGQATIDGDLEFTILKRELINRVGQYTINSFYNANEDNSAVLDWLMTDATALRYYILGGTPDGGSYYNSLTQLAKLYKAYKDDFKIQETTKYDTVLGDLYLRMAIALSLTHSQRVALWMQPGAAENQSDAITRYQIFKELHKNDKFKATEAINITKWFEKYSVEEMRFVMNNLIDDESIVWLNEYVQSKIDAAPASAWGWLTPHPYMAYVWPNYSSPVYYDEANYDYFNDLFSVNGKKLYDYGITRGTADHKVYKLWMNFRNKFGTGAVCGGISKSGSNIRATHGIAATVIGQPGHAAILYYTEDAAGNGYWNIDNNVSGWTLSEKGERMLLGWGNGTYARGSYQVVYMTMAQEALNDYENFEKAEKLIMLARSFGGNDAKREELLRKAIEIQPINIDAWYDLIQLYNASTTKKESDYYALAEEMAEDLKYFPLAMYQFTNLIKPKLTSIENQYMFALLQTRMLNEAKNTPNNTADNYTIYQPSVARVEASYLLGLVDNSIANFSFDGDNAGKIVLSSKFDNSGIRWDYSLDGKTTWKEVSFTAEQEHKLQLTSKEIESITSENDIYVHIVGVDYDEENLFKIDITDGAQLADIFANDLENRIVGVNLNTEWRYTENDSWTSYNVASPDLTGDKTVQIRQGATGTTLASAPSETFTFTTDNQPETRKYIPVSHLTIHGVSTEATNQGGQAAKAIDANYNTRWHSAWNGTDTERYIIIKLDKPAVLSAVEFVPAGGGNGKIYDGTVYGSMDGETWEELSNMKNITYTNQANTIADAIANTKSFDITNEKEVQYVKIVADRTNGNWFTAREFNLYQDLTKNPHPTAGIAYSTTELTNDLVVARLINPSRNITITNNDGSDTYTFSENGEFTFEFVDEYGITGSATAKVTWIDKDKPDADLNYELDNNNKISISLTDISEDVYLLDENDTPINFIEVKNKKVTRVSYLNSDGKTFKTVYVDENGCITKIAYVNTNSNIPTVATYVTTMTDGTITSEEYYDNHGNAVEVTEAQKEELKSLQRAITDPLEYTFEQSGSHEFKLLDKAENITYKSVKVDYDENTGKIITSDISYDITHLTNKNVVATIKPYVFDEDGHKVDAKIVSGGNTHTFDNNTSFTFQYSDKEDEDNIKEHVAKVTWIDKVAPTAEIAYTTKTNGEVVATLTNESEKIIITNNGFSREYTFKKNGEFTFVFEDEAGNVGRATARVDSIRDNVPEQPENPEKPEQPEQPEDPKEPVNPSDPSDPVSPIDPSTPVQPSNPVIPYNPSNPNKGSSNSNNNGNLNSGNKEPSNDLPIEDEPSGDDKEPEKKPNETTDKNDKEKEPSKTEEKTSNQSIKNILIVAIIVIAGAIIVVYFKKKNEM